MTRKTLSGMLAASAMLTLTGSTLAAPDGSMILLGIVRDFKASHPDFGPGIGSTGHVAGLTASNLNSRGNPSLAAAGRNVDVQWLNIDGNPIMPGSAAVAAEGISDFEIVDGTVVSNVPFAAQIKVIGSALTAGSYERPVTVIANVGDDSFAPFGPFSSPVNGNVNDDQTVTGWANEGGNPRSFVVQNIYAAGTPISVVGKSWNRTSRTGGTSDAHWGAFYTADSSSGDRRVIVLRDGDAVPTYAGLAGQDSAAEYIADYVRNGNVTLEDNQAIFLFELGTGDDYQDLVVLVTLATDVSFFESPAPTSPCFTTADAAGSLGDDNTAGISSAASFSQWFADVPGINVSKPQAIRLTQEADGFWAFESDDFTPLDRKGFGNEGAAHNRYFTFEIQAEFTYEACAGQMIEFEGADDAWIFVNGIRMMDLGGTNAGAAQVVEIDRAGLADGDPYTLKFFFAHRASDSAPFRIRTNIPLKTKSKVITATGGLYD